VVNSKIQITDNSQRPTGCARSVDAAPHSLAAYGLGLAGKETKPNEFTLTAVNANEDYPAAGPGYR